MNIYYVYIYINPLTNLPFYVGMGKNKRYLDHLKEAKNSSKSNHKLNTIRKILSYGLEPIIKFFDKNLIREDAIELEKFLISEFGRKDLGTGLLTNLTDGGDGVFNLSESTKLECANKRKGFILAKNTSTNAQFLVHKESELWKNSDIVGINKGKSYGEDFKNLKKIQNSGKNNPMYGRCRPDLIESNKNLELNRIRKNSKLLTIKEKLIVDCGFSDECDCVSYLRYISELYFNFGYFNYYKNILKSIYTYNNSKISKNRLITLLKYFNISPPERRYKIIRD